MVTSRTHLSIGDVLTLLREEFPDVTISKIRFLESQGLVNPERSPSGYRKFYDHDVERLRWVLRQQRENFLPLKVIRDRLAESGGQLPPDEEPPVVGTSSDPGPHDTAAGGVHDTGAGGVHDTGAGGVHDTYARPLPEEGLVRNGNGDLAASSTRAPEPSMVLAEAQPVPRAAAPTPAAPTVVVPPAPTDAAAVPASAAPASTVPVDTAERVGNSAEGHDMSRGMLPGFVLGNAAEATGGDQPLGASEPVASDPGARTHGGAPVHARRSEEGVLRGPSGSGSEGGSEAVTGADVSGASGGPSGGSEPASGPPAAEPTGGGRGDVAAPSVPDAQGGPPSRGRSGRDSGRPGPSGDSGDENLALSFDVSLGVSGVSLTIEELCGATGLSAAEIAALEGFGLVEPLTVAGGRYYDECALAVAHLVSRFGRYGVEPRHLRLYRNAVDRESGLVEQIVTPLLRQRNPEARQRANDAAAELGTLGQQLRAALLRRELRRLLGG